MNGPCRIAWIALLLSACPSFAQPALDRFGDALPPHAVARLGSARFRGAMYNVRFSPDGKTLLTFEPDNPMVLFWDAETGRPMHPIRSKHTISAADFSPDGKHIVYHDGRLRMHDVKADKAAWSIDAPGLRVAFSPDGKLLAGTGNRGVVQIRNAATGDLIHDMKAPETVQDQGRRVPWTQAARRCGPRSRAHCPLACRPR